MKIHVYAGLKDYFKPEFELSEIIGNTDELKACLVAMNEQAGELLQTCRFAVEEGFIDNEFKLQAHDTVIIVLPAAAGNGSLPVAGNSLHPVAGNGPYISAEPLDMVALLKGAHHPGAGAVVLFSGEVREHNSGREVAYLEYEAHGPLASKLIAEILQEAMAKWKLHIAIAQHRTGKVGIGETAVIVITAAAHRSEAYAANRHIIDRIK